MAFEQEIRANGFSIVASVLDSLSIESFKVILKEAASAAHSRGGHRNLLDVTEMRKLANSEVIMKLVRPILGEAAFPVRGILFDKQGGANWKVPWHQDVTIAVANRQDVEGYGPWSIKRNVLHVQPPSSILEKMLSVRLHLDDCPKTNGALRVIPNSHKHGKLNRVQIEMMVAQGVPVTCEAGCGDALLMRPLLIHASSAAERPAHRRVVHFDYANVALASGLRWNERPAQYFDKAFA